MKSENEEVSGRNKIPNGRWREQPIFACTADAHSF